MEYWEVSLAHRRRSLAVAIGSIRRMDSSTLETRPLRQPTSILHLALEMIDFEIRSNPKHETRKLVATTATLHYLVLEPLQKSLPLTMHARIIMVSVKLTSSLSRKAGVLMADDLNMTQKVNCYRVLLELMKIFGNLHQRTTTLLWIMAWHTVDCTEKAKSLYAQTLLVRANGIGGGAVRKREGKLRRTKLSMYHLLA